MLVKVVVLVLFDLLLVTVTTVSATMVAVIDTACQEMYFVVLISRVHFVGQTDVTEAVRTPRVELDKFAALLGILSLRTLSLKSGSLTWVGNCR